MRTDDNGLELIITEENTRLTPYPDSIGVWTVGTGHRLLPNDSFPEIGITQGMVLELLASPAITKPTWKITPVQVKRLLSKDVESVENFLNFFLRRNNLTISQTRFNVLVDFGFNEGVGNLGRLLSHGLDQVPLQLSKWEYAGGKLLTGLENRRNKEISLWNMERV